RCEPPRAVRRALAVSFRDPYISRFARATTVRRASVLTRTGVLKMTTAVETLTREPVLEDYFGLSDAELYERIEAARRRLSTRLVILGHHYQRDDVVCHADYTGDSFKPSKLAASRPEADYVVFCGLHFMAESADILKPGNQK